MSEGTSDTKKNLITKIQNQLEDSSLEELDHIQHVLSAMEKEKNGGLYYLAEFLGIEWNENNASMRLGRQHANTYGVAQGGTIYTFADMTMGYRVLSELPPGKSVQTIEMKMNFISPGKGQYLFSKPNILHVGRNTAVVECQVQDDQNKLVAKGLGTFFIFDQVN